MNHQEAKDLLITLLPEESLSLIKVEVFRLSWEGKGYNVVAEESGYDHDYVRKAGSQLWKELTQALGQSITKRNFRPLLEATWAADSAKRSQRLEYPGGAMQFSSPFYIERSEEEARAYQEIQRPGSILRIKGPRKMGKRSLMLRVIDQAESEGFHLVKIDFLQADRAILTDLDRLLRWVCLQAASQLGLDVKLEDHWNELIGSKLSASNFLQQAVLAKLDQPMLLVINELNLVFDDDNVSRDFLPLLRSWHEESKHNTNMQKLRQMLVYSTEVYVQLDMNLSPFNVGLPIELKPFDGDQIAALASVYGFNWRNDGNASSPIQLLLTSLGGHPYLCQLTLYELANQADFMESPSQGLKQLLAGASAPGGLFSEFLQQLLQDYSANADAVSGFKKLRSDQEDPLSRIEMYQLERLGLVSIQNGQPIAGRHLLTDYLASHDA
ncbi:AAA-like domain-containing protein [Ferrimonas marina]|uniref:AAA-like domain-containing protein n=1 Tax=Ferrimonas marina TaxID=299255 RepID=A0A1M5MLK8_9GAMM|nr:AAA-like domain-containing protein [Ferrimonas marina]SHG78087.1 AAA-like domain-containing protein [Ferrimonas marina]